MPNADSAESAGALSWLGLICGRLAPASGYTAALAPSSLTPPPKGLWLIRCTVDGLTPNRSAILRTPGRPGLASAARMASSTLSGIGGRPKRLPTTCPRNPGADSFLNHRSLKLGENAHHLKHRLARRRTRPRSA
jgi:hypothetical protein